jgi:hypothetical protein
MAIPIIPPPIMAVELIGEADFWDEWVCIEVGMQSCPVISIRVLNSDRKDVEESQYNKEVSKYPFLIMNVKGKYLDRFHSKVIEI